MSAIYAGPQCPYCEGPLDPAEMRTGVMQCVHCTRTFESTVFQPVQRRYQAAEVLTATPEGVANACANHARNAAVTNCQRCGLFICALCDMNVGEGSYCPSCFDRVRAEGALKSAATRYRDYASMARVAAIVGVFLSMAFLGLPFGALTVYYSVKGIKQRRAEGAPIGGMVVAMIFGILEAISTFVLIGLIVLASRK